MKIAAITITRNDFTRVEQWKTLYSKYKDDISWHIIIDNASSNDYIDYLESSFPKSIIIKRKTNGGCTSAYNDGIRYALNHTDCDAIAIICNDTKVCDNFYPVLYDYLFSDDALGMVSPTALKKDTNIINNFGHEYTKTLEMVGCYEGIELSSFRPKSSYTTMLLGGNNLAKRSFYEQVGLQDEKIFMYSDEIDTAIRAEKANIKLGVTTEAISMHYHIPLNNATEKNYYNHVLMQRNKVYLARKHFGHLKMADVFIRLFYKDIMGVFVGLLKGKRELVVTSQNALKGAFLGLFNDMSNDRWMR